MPTSVTIGTGMTKRYVHHQRGGGGYHQHLGFQSSAPGGITQSVTLLAAQDTSLASISCSPQTLTGSGQATCALTLPAPAPTGGLNVPLSSSTTQLTVPTIVRVPQGNTGAAFNATASVINNDERATITATLPSASVQSAVCAVIQPVAMGCTPKSVNAGSPLSCQVTLSAAATSTGVALNVSTSNTHLTPPASVPVPVGQSVISFQATTSGLTQKQTGVITASFGSHSVQDTVTIAVAPPTLVVPGPQSARPGKTTAFTVAANDPAGMATKLSVLGLPQLPHSTPAAARLPGPQAAQIGPHRAIHGYQLLWRIQFQECVCECGLGYAGYFVFRQWRELCG
jgi:hypothetical protein